ncbi:MAG: TolC family protein, partial [Duncaniella sp.]|nr:TolC family protein [Duncaniella sp.]
MKKIALPAFTAALVATFATARAEGNEWSYATCVEYAREHNIDLRKAMLAERTAGINLSEAEAQWYPTLDFSTGQGYVNTPWGRETGTRPNAYNSSYSLNASWSLYDGGVRSNTIRQDRLVTEQKGLETEQTFRSIETDLLQVYLNILYTREAIGIYEEAERLSRAQAERGKALMESGRISRVDYSRLATQNEQDRYELVNARATYSTRLTELRQLLELGIDADVAPASVEWTDDEVTAPLPDLAESYAMAVTNDLPMRSYSLAREIADLDIEIARAGARPRISVNAAAGTGYMAPGGEGFGTALRHNLNENIGLTLSVPILDQKKTRSATARATVQRMEADLDMEKRETTLAQLVESSFIDTRAAQSRFEAAMQQLESAILTDSLTNEQ